MSCKTISLRFILVLLTVSLPEVLLAIEPADSTGKPVQTSPATAAEPAITAETPAQSSQTAPAADNAAIEEQSGFSRGSVVRSVFTSAIDQREPVDKLKTVEQDQPKVFYFTELRDMTGQTAKHRWQHDGKVIAEVDFNVQGPRWRVWSAKSLNPNATGEWKVSVVNGAGEIIAEELLSVADTSTTTEKSSMPAAETQAPADSMPAQQ